MAAIPQQSDLPEGWKVRQVEQGKIYYVNHKTKKTSWVNPSLLGEQSDLPEGWEARQTEEGKIYYVDHKTKTSSWVNHNLAKQQRGGLEEKTLSSTQDMTVEVSDDCVSRRGINQMWTPLQSAFSIRILKLLPGLDKQPIECVLDTASLDGEGCRYQALSYMWNTYRTRRISSTLSGRADYN